MDEKNTRKLIVGFKNKTSVITLTDIDDTDFYDDVDEIANVFQEKNVCKIFTKKDCLVFNPQELAFVLISNNTEIKKQEQTKKEPENKKENKPKESDIDKQKKNEYKQKLIVKLNDE